MAKANTKEPGVVKTTIGLASIASSDAVISPRADYGVTASKAKANTRIASVEPGVALHGGQLMARRYVISRHGDLNRYQERSIPDLQVG